MTRAHGFLFGTSCPHALALRAGMDILKNGMMGSFPSDEVVDGMIEKLKA